MNMSLRILLTMCVFLEMIGIALCINPIKEYFISKYFYNEYMKEGLDVLIEEMKEDGFKGDFTIEKMKMSMDMQLADARIKRNVGIIGLVVMVGFLAKTLMMLF